MKSFRMSWFLVIVLLSCTPNSLTLASNNIKLPSTVVVGSVYCDTCFQAEFSKNSHFISGASVAVECQDGNSSPSFRKEVKTDRLGKFRVQLPFSVSKDANKIEGCSVKLVRSSEPNCALASTATSSSLHLKARKQGAHIFSAGFFTFKPQKQPDLCSQKPSVQNFKELSSRKTLISPNIDPALPPLLQDPTAPGIPTIPGMPNLPSLPPQPQLPPLPTLTPGVPGVPSVPGKKQKVKKTESSKTTRFADNKNVHPETFFPTQELPPLPPVPGLPSLPPNPLLPPSTPGVLPPNPLQPPSIPGLLPPNPLLPPSVPGILPPNPLQPPSIPGLLPPNPLLPPSVPGILPPNPLQPPSTPGVLPPNPLLPPPNPGLLPPVPLLPPPLPPNPVLPPPAPLIPLPPVPGLTPPPPAKPSFPIPLPPGFPGSPPASSSPKKSTP